MAFLAGLLALLPLIASAQVASKRSALPDCLRPKGYPAPASYEELRACQDDARWELLERARRRGREMSNAEREALDEHQRAEARRFMARSREVIEGPAQARLETAAGPAAAQPPTKSALGGASPKDLSRAGAGPAGEIAGLQAKLRSMAGDGSSGITPEMTAEIRAVLARAQGGVSPAMGKLLDAVERDGGKLTPDAMKELQNGVRAAKGEGLELNIDPKLEKEMLERDFDADKPYFPQGGAGL